MFSVVASETSALTFISIPGLAYIGNLGFLQVVAGYILGRIVVANVLLPRYYQGELVTAYALLEKRFGLATRRFTSIVFMVTRGMADSVRVFATAIPIALITREARMPQEYVMPPAILILGVLTVMYTYKGGMKAVVWTELLQASVYVLGGISARDSARAIGVRAAGERSSTPRPQRTSCGSSTRTWASTARTRCSPDCSAAHSCRWRRTARIS